MRTFNIKVSNIQRQTKPVNNQYKDSLDNILDSNIDDIMPKTVFIKPGLKQSFSIIKLSTPQNVNVLQLLKNFGESDSK